MTGATERRWWRPWPGLRARPGAPAVAALTIAIALGAVGPARAEDALIAVAASFAGIGGQLASELASSEGHRVVLTIGSTGKLATQIARGAPFHAFLAADEAAPAKLEAEGHAIAGSRFTYALGRLVVWSADPRRIDGDGRAALAAPGLRFVALANPDLAPYGQAARQTLLALGLWEKLQGRIAVGQNVGHAGALVASGAAEVGFVALSSLSGPKAMKGGSCWIVPSNMHSPIRQQAVLLRHGEHNRAARRFLALLREPAARARIVAHGFAVQ